MPKGLEIKQNKGHIPILDFLDLSSGGYRIGTKDGTNVGTTWYQYAITKK